MKSTDGEISSVASTPRRSATYRSPPRRLPSRAATDLICDRKIYMRLISRGVAEIELERLTKVYADGTRAVDELDLEVADGEFVVFVGPSGCGKTSALRMIAGLEDISSGTVRVAGDVVNDLPPKARDMAMIFQNYALYPHMNAYDNMAFGLKMRGLDRSEIRRRVESAAEILGLA